MAYAEVEDVTDGYEGEGTLNESRVQVELDRAHRVLNAALRRRGDSLDERVTAGSVEEEDVKIVLVNMVLRVLRNPAGYKNEQAGDYGYSRDLDVAGGRLRVTTEDLELLGISTGKRVGTIKVGSSYRASTVLDAES